jgi:hypothetical protein
MKNEKLKFGRQLRSARARRVPTVVLSLRMALVPALVLPDVVAVVPAVPVVAVVFPFSASLALVAGEGAVRTTVAVSLRGTACCVAFAASCGLTPMVVGAEAFGAGAVVCAETLAIVSVNTTARGMTFMKGFMGPALIKRGGNNTNKRAFESCNLRAEMTI